jgi:hypothetical protein
MVILAAALAASGAAQAGPLDAKTIQIVAKTFDFLSHKPAPGAKVVVVAGAADPTAVQAALSKLSVSAGKPADAAGAFAIFVNSPEEAKAARAANASVFTIGGDLACVTSGSCLMAVETQPKVTIYVSRAAAQASGIEFDPNFKMLITEK